MAGLGEKDGVPVIWKLKEPEDRLRKGSSHR